MKITKNSVQCSKDLDTKIGAYCCIYHVRKFYSILHFIYAINVPKLLSN